MSVFVYHMEKTVLYLSHSPFNSVFFIFSLSSDMFFLVPFVGLVVINSLQFFLAANFMVVSGQRLNPLPIFFFASVARALIFSCSSLL